MGGLDTHAIPRVVWRNRVKIGLVLLVLLGAGLRADEIGVCLKDLKRVWDVQQWKCRKATAEELPWAGVGIKKEIRR